MSKIEFKLDDTNELVEFYIVEETRINGSDYLLVADSQEEDGECLILKDKSEPQEEESLYEIVEDETELDAVLKIFEGLIEDIEIEK